MKNYLIKADIGEGYPYYIFMVNANDENEARDKAEKIVLDDYGHQIDENVKVWENNMVREVKTLEDIINDLLI